MTDGTRPHDAPAASPVVVTPVVSDLRLRGYAVLPAPRQVELAGPVGGNVSTEVRLTGEKGGAHGSA